MVSNKEDARPPYMKEEQAKQMQEQSDPEGQRRIAQLIAKALKNPNPKPERTMPKSGETRAVREVKEAMAKAKAKRSTSVEKTVDNTSIHNPQVVQLKDQSEPSIHNLEVVPNHNLGVVLNTDIEHREIDIKSRVKDKVINKPNVLHNLEVSDFDFLIDNKMKPEQIEEALATLLPLFAAEGLNPASKVLADSILQLHRDVR